MIKKTFTYNDYNGLERTEEHYFGLNKAEITEWEMSMNGGMTAFINSVIAAQDQPSLVKLFKNLILLAYGVKSLDGKRFMKEKPDGSRYADEFKETEPYSMLFMELATDADAAAAFINGIMPEDVVKELAAANKTQTANFVASK